MKWADSQVLGKCSCGNIPTSACDYRVRGRPCDNPLCDYCAKVVGPDRHYCKFHAKKAFSRGRKLYDVNAGSSHVHSSNT